ncbi:hypothetical protein DSO57_1005309 [Entomophthora muscae]|uniref:Uncharacterized protein n=1 Tax=Entomophthora muscae TaxID=34485 RepID=A0ACC2UGX7_9FUNG|nr:hypothetical protein DSO57_1005309 [Entomophthora muscae]
MIAIRALEGGPDAESSNDSVESEEDDPYWLEDAQVSSAKELEGILNPHQRK